MKQIIFHILKINSKYPKLPKDKQHSATVRRFPFLLGGIVLSCLKSLSLLFQRKPPNRTNVHSIYHYLGSICRPVASTGRASLKNSGGSPGSCPVRMDTLVVESRGGEVAVSDIF